VRFDVGSEDIFAIESLVEEMVTTYQSYTHEPCSEHGDGDLPVDSSQETHGDGRSVAFAVDIA
jgi:hypothetical protein